jgi:hypothetical protein
MVPLSGPNGFDSSVAVPQPEITHQHSICLNANVP